MLQVPVGALPLVINDKHARTHAQRPHAVIHPGQGALGQVSSAGVGGDLLGPGVELRGRHGGLLARGPSRNLDYARLHQPRVIRTDGPAKIRAEGEDQLGAQIKRLRTSQVMPDIAARADHQAVRAAGGQQMKVAGRKIGQPQAEGVGQTFLQRARLPRFGAAFETAEVMHRQSPLLMHAQTGRPSPSQPTGHVQSDAAGHDRADRRRVFDAGDHRVITRQVRLFVLREVAQLNDVIAGGVRVTDGLDPDCRGIKPHGDGERGGVVQIGVARRRRNSTSIDTPPTGPVGTGAIRRRSERSPPVAASPFTMRRPFASAI